jgi:hypothetical protein
MRLPSAAPSLAATGTHGEHAGRSLAALFALCVVALAGVAWWLLKSGRGIGRDGWFITPHPPWPLSASLLPIGSLAIFGGLALACAYDCLYRAKSPREQRTSLRLALGALALLSAGWNWGLLGPAAFSTKNQVRPSTFNVLAVAWSDVATEYLSTAYRASDARSFSRSYATSWQSPRSPVIAHVATHPPGAVLFYFACRRAVENSPSFREWLLVRAEAATGVERTALARELNDIRFASARSGVAADKLDAIGTAPLPVEAIATALLASSILSLAPALAVPALFLLGSSCAPFEQRRAQGRGLLAAGLWVLAPTVGLFALTLDALVALGAAWTLALVAGYLRAAGGGSDGSQAARKYLLGAGAVLALTGFVSFGALTVGVVAALWLVSERRWRGLLWLAAGAGAMQCLILLAFPHALPTVFAQAMDAHRGATLTTRSYGGWLALNPLMFALFASGPVLLGALGALFQQRVWKDAVEADAVAARAVNLALAAAGAMLLISLAGSVRGEVERLWMFLLPPFCAAAASAWVPLNPGPRRGKVALVGTAAVLAAVLVAVQTLLMAATLAPLVLPIG